MKMGKQEVEIR